MGRRSTVEQLPPDILAQLQALLLDPRCSQLDATLRINAILAEKDQPGLSKSAVGRYAQSFEDLTKEMVETDRIATLMMSELNISNQSNVGQVMSETLRVMMLRFMPMIRKAMANEQIDTKEMKLMVGMLKDLTQGHERLEQSSTLNQKRVAEIERATAEKTKQQAADQAVASATQAGVSKETRDKIRREVLGMA